MSNIKLISGFSSNLARGVKQRFFKNRKTNRAFNIGWLQEKFYKHAPKGKLYTHRLNEKIQVSFTDPQAFLLSVRELFIEEIYKFRTDNPEPFIIDCGAHIGMSILYFKLNYPEARIIAFEPDEHNYNLTKKNLESWGFQNVELIRKAVWVHNETISFNQTNDMGSSIVTDSSSAAIQIPAARLRDYLNQKVDFIKLDIEGAEYEVVQDCDDLLKNAGNIFLEYHGNYNEMHKLNTQLNIVQKNGFAYYIKEAGNIYERPFFDREKFYSYDVQLNIFCFKP